MPDTEKNSAEQIVDASPELVQVENFDYDQMAAMAFGINLPKLKATGVGVFIPAGEECNAEIG